MRILVVIILANLLVTSAWATRLKDLANIRGVRDNQLIGYGIVVGLNGSGDSGLEYTNKSVVRMLDKLGVKLDNGDVGSKNVAAVIVTAQLPPFSRAGNKIDVTVNSVGDAKSLKGGTLLQTPLRAANQQVYAVAQGTILIGEQEEKTVGRITNGGIIEREVASDYSNRKMFRFTLNNPDFTTAARMAKTINNELGGVYATAIDAGTLDLVVPYSYEGRGVELLASLEALDVVPDLRAKVVVNEKTGTVIIGEGVKIKKVAISHGALTVRVGQPAAGANGASVRGPASQSSGGSASSGDKTAVLDGDVSVGQLVEGLNNLGVTPKDLITILQSIKAAGALQADLEIM